MKPIDELVPNFLGNLRKKKSKRLDLHELGHAHLHIKEENLD
jgi:hypothetical protein